jgi:hypothetical protein
MCPTSGEIEREQIRERNRIDIEDPAICYYCSSTGLKTEDAFCPNCGFPQGGSQGEMQQYVRNVHNKKRLLEEQKDAVKKAKNILFILAALNLLGGLFLGLIINNDTALLIGCLVAAGIYFALGLWSRTQPFPAILTGFFIYIVLIGLEAIGDPSTILKGIIIKGFIIYGFIYGYKGAKDSQRLETELKEIGKAKDLSVES